MPRPKGSKNKPEPSVDMTGFDDEEWQEDQSTAAGVPPSALQHGFGGAFDDAPLLPPTTPSGSSSSPSRQPPTSPSKSASSAGSRKPISSKQHLTQMSPSVSFHNIKQIKDESTPQAAKVLWGKYIASAAQESRVVPSELKAPLETEYNTPKKTNGPIANNVYAPRRYSDLDLSSVLEGVKDVVHQAEIYHGNCHESQWVSKVVTPIMSQIQKLRSSVLGGRGISDMNIATVKIAPSVLFPTSLVNTFRDGNKKVDYALALKLTSDEDMVLKSAVKKYRVPGGASINQTQSDWTAFVPMFTPVEVKVDGSDPLIQLGIWVSAEVEKRYLEAYTFDLPFPAIAVSNHQWDFWIAYAEELSVKQQQGGKSYRVRFLGPIDMGHTRNATGVFRILHVLKAIVRWGLEVYEPDFMENVFKRYSED
ncbi:MAG: hypothetical protein Q9215_005699 [Flavoplaca cf. flavocitrina]